MNKKSRERVPNIGFITSKADLAVSSLSFLLFEMEHETGYFLGNGDVCTNFVCWTPYTCPGNVACVSPKCS